jgi:clan AA aspartic protease (TIGR02281 family)
MRKLFLLTLALFLTFLGQTQTVIKMRKVGNVSVIPCKVNGLNLSFIFDTGASDVSISMTEATFMLKNDYLSESDIVGSQNYLDANGNISQGINIILKEVEIAGLKLYNVKASIVRNLQAPLLLGQSAISKLGTIQLDLQSNILTILKGDDSYNFSEDKARKIPKLSIGQSYNGGTIFYIDETGNHGLIVLDKAIWVGTGRGTIGSWYDATGAISHLDGDWRLPSKDELNLLRLNKNILKREMRYNASGQPIGDEVDGIYWSSTENYNNTAWTVDFSNGEQTCFDKKQWIGIKAIKSF